MILKKLEELSQKYMNALSEESDIEDWNKYLQYIEYRCINDANNKLLKFSRDRMNEIFYEYLLKHHPNNLKLKNKYSSENEIYNARKYGHRKMLLLYFGEIPSIVNKWEFKNGKEYRNYISLVKEYVYYKNYSENDLDVVNSSYGETEKCKNLNNDELINLLIELSSKVLNYTEEQNEWHDKVKRLSKCRKEYKVDR